MTRKIKRRTSTTPVSALGRMFIYTVLALATFTPAARAAEDPRAGQLDARVRFVDYRPYQVVRVTGLLRHSIQIEFSPDEEILQAAIGNTVAWEAAPVGHILFLKPREQQEPTNMSMVTQRPDGTKRSYQFELTSTDQDIKGQRPFYLLKYQYPADEAVKRKAEAAAVAELAKSRQAERALAGDETALPRNAHYMVQGAASFEPRSVSDNGKITTLCSLRTWSFRRSTWCKAMARKAWFRKQSLATRSAFMRLAPSSSCARETKLCASSTRPTCPKASPPAR